MIVIIDREKDVASRGLGEEEEEEEGSRVKFRKYAYIYADCAW